MYMHVSPISTFELLSQPVGNLVEHYALGGNP